MTAAPGPDRAAEVAGVAEDQPEQSVRPPAQRAYAGVFKTALGWDDDEDDDRPLPEFPPLPDDPRWRIEHLPFVLAVGFALVLCSASAGFLIGGRVIALGAGAGTLVVTVGVSLTTLAIAWADVIRPQLVMPVGLTVYVIKYALILFLMIAVANSGWPGGDAMAWGIAVGAVVLTGVQVWWLTRLAARRAS